MNDDSPTDRSGDDTSDDTASDDGHDPRLDEPEGQQGMPGELIDGDANLPGDQPVDDDPPSVSEVYGRD